MKTSTAVSAGAIGLALLVLPSFAHAQMRPTQLTWVDRNGKVIETVGPFGTYVGPELAPDGKRIAVHRHDPTNVPGQRDGGDVLIFDGVSSTGVNLTAQRSAATDNSMPIWSPDGTRVVYGSIRNGKGGLYVRRADGSGAEELLFESDTSKVPVSWSPDDKYIVYWSPGNIQWILPLTGDRRPFQLSPGETSYAQISPDGKWVAYQVAAYDADDEIFVKPFPRGAAQVQVSRNGGAFPRWSADGKELFYLSGPADALMAAPMSVNGSKIVAGTPSPLFESGYMFQFHGAKHHAFAVSRDGRRFLIPRRDSASASDDPNARTLTVIDRRGNTVATVGEPGLYSLPAFSPDRTRVALMRNDPARNIGDVWVFDVASGKGTRFTTSTRDERRTTPVWSPDGRYIAYLVAKDDVQRIYRKLANGDGPEEHVYTLPLTNATLSEWTSDGRYITYYSPQLGGNVVFALPLSGDPKPVEVVRSQLPIFHARLSRDNRFVAFRSPEAGKEQIWVTRFDPSGSNRDKVQVCPDGCTAPVYWSEDGKELYYLSLDRGMMAAAVRAESEFTIDGPRLLFKVPETFAAGAAIGGATSMSRDGERFILAIPRTPPPPPPAAPLPQITILNLQGLSVQTVGEPGRFFEPVLSPDRSRVLVGKNAETAGRGELWSFEVATGKGTLIASEQPSFMLWSRDGQYVFYVITKPGGVPAIVRKPADGSGSGETIYEHTPGAPLNVTDITSDGRFLVFDSGGVLTLLPLARGSAGAREPLEILRDEYIASQPRFSPDGRTIAYLSDQTGRDELYVQSFNPASRKLVGRARQVTTDGASRVIGWRPDGKELYYDKADLGAGLVKAVDVSATTLQTGTPRVLFRLSGRVSRDGQSFVAVLSPQN